MSQSYRARKLLEEAGQLMLKAVAIEAPDFHAILLRAKQAEKREDKDAVRANTVEASEWLETHKGQLPLSVVLISRILGGEEIG